MAFDPRDIVLLVFGGLNLVLGFLIFARLARSRINVAFGLVTLGIFGWSLGLAFFESTDTLSHALNWARLYYISAAFIAYVFLLFARAFPYAKNPISRLSEAALGVPFLAICIMVFTPLHIEALFIQPWGKDVILGWGYVVYTVYFIMYMGIAFFLLWRKGRESIGIRKLQIRYVLLGTLITTAGGATTNLILPLVGDYRYIWLGPLFTLFLITFIAIAIVRYKLMSIRLVASRLLQYAFSFATSFVFVQIVLFAFGAFGRDLFSTQSLLVGGVLALLVIFLHDPFDRLFATITANIFFRGQPDYQKLLRDMGLSISEEVSQEGLVRAVSMMLQERLKVRHARVYILDEASGGYALLAGDTGAIAAGSTLVSALSSEPVLVAEEVELEQNEAPTKGEYARIGLLVDELHGLDISLARRVMVEGNLVAIVALGPKLSKDIFDRQLIDAFDVLAPQMATALGRTKLYDEAQQFAVKLKKEVDDATAELQVANAHLKQLDQSKSEFLSIAAHQLRTPLTGIKGYVSMFLDGDYGVLTPEQRGELERIFRSSDRLTRLIDVFLNVSRIETGRLELTKSSVRFEEIVDEVVGDLQHQAKTKGLELTVQKPDGPLPAMSLDRDKIHDVMMNLVDNAIKYTDTGWVNVRLARSKSLITFEVRDSGMGIDPIEMDRLFQKFTRAEATTRIHTGGSGLGLFIAKKIIEAHGGRVWAESEGEGKGSMFTFTLPIAVE
ncbi:MAG: hypothetical protein HYT31_03310 [Parcubacteria group bacterium]|nr:hypothetical protein [Parcubacteria group bacterium]